LEIAGRLARLNKLKSKSISTGKTFVVVINEINLGDFKSFKYECHVLVETLSDKRDRCGSVYG
jgi:hypothetical protein